VIHNTQNYWVYGLWLHPEFYIRRNTRFRKLESLLKNGVFWDVWPCGSCKNLRFEELSTSFIRVTRIGELGTTLAVISHPRTLRRNTKSVLTRTTRRNIPEDAILHNHRRENLKSYLESLLFLRDNIIGLYSRELGDIHFPRNCFSRYLGFRIMENVYKPSYSKRHMLVSLKGENFVRL
jgi:hypothetical protein